MLINKVKETIVSHNLIKEKQHIVAGLSGGPDSVCLFHVLMKLKEEMNLVIHPVHINHKFRPGEAERDQAYAEKLCEKYGVRCTVFEIDCVKLADELHMTGEEAGRKARYDSFYKTAEKAVKEYGVAQDDVKIAVAHNADDQAETILFRMLRGTGTDGLAGISYKREERGFEVIRPVLDVTRAEIEEYCRENGLDPVTDHTNEEEIYTRNKIRLSLLPMIEKNFNENIKASLVRLGRIAADDKEYIWQQTEEAYRELLIKENETEIIMEREGLSNMHTAVRHRLILKAFGRIGLDKDISEERIKAADAIIEKKQAPKTVEFPRNYRLKVAAGKVTFFKN